MPPVHLLKADFEYIELREGHPGGRKGQISKRAFKEGLSVNNMLPKKSRKYKVHCKDWLDYGTIKMPVVSVLLLKG